MRHLDKTKLRYPSLWRQCVFAAAPCLGVSGLVLRDYGGRNSGTFTNLAAETAWGITNKVPSITGNGTNGFVNCGIVRPMNVGSGPYTINIWVYGGQNGRTVVAKSNAAGDGGYYFSCRTVSGNYYWYDGTVRDIGVKTNDWHMLTATRISTSANHAFLYYDGELAVTFTDSRSISSGDNLCLLGLSGETFGTATLASVMFWTRPLSGKTIRSMWAGKPLYPFSQHSRRVFSTGQSFSAAWVRRQALVQFQGPH